ncbi:MAG: VanW family protein [Dethiobacter sp.]|nr:VanW family protein [Dethiobacter sp.]
MATKKRVTVKLTTILLLLAALGLVFIVLGAGSGAQRLFYGVKPGVKLEGVVMEKLLEKEVRARVSKMASAINRAPRNAAYDNKTKSIILEIPGLEVDVDATVTRVMDAEKDEHVDLTVIILEPELTADIYRSISIKLSSFGTTGGGGGRADNLYVAAKYMNGTVLAPGDVFSFNKATGPRTFARGYGMAPVVGGVGIGGGVCQVATTIYNAAMIAGMEIIERHPHSIRVYYVPEGRDATITNYIDFKFRNSTDKFIQIRSGAGGGHVWVQIWSQ